MKTNKTITFLVKGILLNTFLFFPNYAFTQYYGYYQDGKEIDAIYKDKLKNRKSPTVGATFGLTIDMLGVSSNNSLRFFCAIGIARNVKLKNDKNNFLFSSQIEFEVYNGGIGNTHCNYCRFKDKKWIWEFKIREQITFGRDASSGIYFNKPLFPSIGQSMSTLIDPFNLSLTVASTQIFRKEEGYQRLGMLRLGAYPLSIHYFNDGDPYDYKWFGYILGDGEDRLWTGDGAIGFYLGNNFFNGFISEISIRYDRFTGFEKNLFEAFTAMQLNYLMYKDQSKQLENKGRYQIRIGFKNQITTSLSIFNPKRDVQKLIHYNSIMALHPPALNKTKYQFGIDYQFNYIPFIR